MLDRQVERDLMNRHFIAVYALLVIVTAACADVRHVRMVWTDSTHQRAELVAMDENIEPATPQYGYDNWRNSILGGVSERIGNIRVGSLEVGDDVVMATSGRLTGENYSIVHMGTSGIGTSYIQTNRWFDSNGVLLQDFTFQIDASASNFGPGTMLYVRAGDGFWTFLNLQLPQQVYASHQWSNPIGMDINDFGQAIAGPRTIGYSSQYIRNFTTGQDIDLGSDQLNLCLALRVDPVPAPSAASLFAASSLLALRRRRTLNAKY
jgi:hypothetical protein